MKPQPNNRYREYKFTVPSQVADVLKRVARENGMTETALIMECVKRELSRGMPQSPDGTEEVAVAPV